MKRLFIITLFSALPFFTQAQTLYVDSTAALGGNGGSWSTAFTELSDALDSAWHNPMIQEVQVAKGTYMPLRNPYEMDTNRVGDEHNESQITNKFKTFHIRTGLKLRGSYPNGGGVQNYNQHKSILSGVLSNGDSVYHVAYIDSSNCWAQANDTTIIDGFQVQNGNANDANTVLNTSINGIQFGNSIGGGICLRGGATKIANCILTRNSAISGGGFYSASGTNNYGNIEFLELVNCSIEDNIAITNAGGVLKSKFIYLHNCEIVKNTSTYNLLAYVSTGGVYIYCDTGVAFNNIIKENNSIEISGLIVSGKIIVRNNLISNNTGNHSVCLLGEAQLINNVVYSNIGHGIYAIGIDTEILNNTVVNNSLDALNILYSVKGHVNNNIFWNNRRDFLVVATPLDTIRYETKHNCFQSDSQSFTWQNNQSLGWYSTGNIFNTSPIFVDINDPIGPDNIFGTADDGLRLAGNSPCIDAGDNTSIPTGVTSDVTGAPRIENGIVNMGAYESVAWPTAVSDILKNDKLSIYPNPADQEITLETETEGTLVLTDILGNKIKTIVVKSGRTQLDVSNLASGTYFFQVSNEGKIWNTKFIKK